MAVTLDYTKLRSDRIVGIWGGPTSAATGIASTAVPTAPEINGSAGSGVLNWAPSVSWNDYDFGVQESETITDPSFADESTVVDFGAKNYGGGISFYYPKEYDDNSNNHSLVYDQTDTPRTKMDVAVRIDGDKRNNTQAADGDFIHVFRTMTDSESNVLAQPDAFRRTVGFLSQGDAEFYTIVGAHTITALPPATAPWAAGNKARLRGVVQGRDYTNALTFSSADPEIVSIFSGGFYEVTGTVGEEVEITITDRAAGTSEVIQVIVE